MSVSDWYLAEAWTNCFVSRHSPPRVTFSVTLADAPAVLPALSAAAAVRVELPTGNVSAGALVPGRKDVAEKS